MKYIKCIWICSVLLLLLTACGENNGKVGNAPNYHLYITNPSAGDTTLEFFVSNTLSEDAEILLIPTLEIQDNDGQWTVIPTDQAIGFCGTPDPLPVEGKEWSLELDELWNNLYKGKYRLSFSVTDAAGEEHTASGEFTLTYDIVQIER